MGGARIFVSYSSKDRVQARRLVSALLLNGLSVWFDEFDLDVGADVYATIEQGIVQVDFVAVVLTASSVDSAWVAEELSLARQRELEDRDIVVLPLLFEDVALPLSLRKRRYADFSDFDTGLAALLRAVDRRMITRPIDQHVLTSIREVLTAGPGREAIAGGQDVVSQNAARLVRGSVLHPGGAERVLREEPDFPPSAVVHVVVRSANTRVPIAVDLGETAGHVLARVLRALLLDEVVAEQRVGFFLLHGGFPLETDETLETAGVNDGDLLELGLYSFFIE